MKKFGVITNLVEYRGLQSTDECYTAKFVSYIPPTLVGGCLIPLFILLFMGGFAGIGKIANSQTSYQLSCPCSTCYVGNCQCTTNCSSGYVDIFEGDNCGGLADYSLTISGGVVTWSPEEEKTYHAKIFCDDGETSNCTSITVCSAPTTTSTTSTTSTSTTSTIAMSTSTTSTITTSTTTTLPQETKLEIVPSSQTGNVNATFTINVTATNVTELFAAQFDVSFDASILNCTSFTEGNFMGETIGFDPTINNTAGKITGFAKTKTGQKGVNGSGTLAVIEFTASSPGTATLILNNVRLKNSSIVDIPTSVVNGALTTTKVEVKMSPLFHIKRVNSTFTINVTVTNVTDLFAVQFDVSFNASILNCTSFTEGNFMGETIGFDPIINNTAGKITGFAKTKTGQVGANGSGDLAIINFTALGNGTSPLTLSNVKLKNSLPTDLSFTKLDSSIKIVMQGPGDINDNCKVDLFDLGFLGQAWQSSEGDENWNNHADLNSDGKVDLLDLGALGENWGNVY